MESGGVLGFSEPKSEGLSPEEKDNLLRSTKKPKVQEESKEVVMSMESQEVVETVVLETQGETVVLETPSPAKDQAQRGTTLFETDTSMRLRRKVVSYKDTILGVNGDSSEDSGSEDCATEDDSDSEEASSTKGEDEKSSTGDPLCQDVQISGEEYRNACKQWKKSVIIKVLGKRVGRGFLYSRLSKLWNPRGDLELIDLENEYFLIRFSASEDYDMVFEDGPWMILGHYVVVQKWQPNFFPWEDELRRVAVWIRVLGLPMEYYDRTIL
ncbi:hypothetical protein SESBI_35587 [Sesbania bispinosa]|nr:hypothetical protein SESBI_35587 [Sesbania bispinosa]